MKICLQEIFIFEEIFEEYVNDMFELLDSFLMFMYFIFLWKDLFVQREIFQFFSVSCRFFNDGSKSEEEVFMIGELGIVGCMISFCVFFSLYFLGGKCCKF